MAKNGNLLVDGKNISEVLKSAKDVHVVDGRVYTCSRFGDQVSHAEICESKEMKGLRADAFILCSSWFLIA
eukprot:CAMPEP_0185571666 /NCGR_PEP_ID=MMETSP0434-20130131/3683_1 /TAXON_ID=626734 ORGANISM="Favella taraikaensis, Strain Fe Narragansett Bay" /NCGR_SAMPLE_ID=MMETSP0434 /ASSEMBLY_ACC=CAM_ASM_000379 /LENGTH=70 /DNA_ID=CAMNT_0028187201 /DNA_START=338 /DNA_END=550 /DNA_ORIENTATION=+